MLAAIIVNCGVEMRQELEEIRTIFLKFSSSKFVRGALLAKGREEMVQKKIVIISKGRSESRDGDVRDSKKVMLEVFMENIPLCAPRELPHRICAVARERIFAGFFNCCNLIRSHVIKRRTGILSFSPK